MRNVKKALGIVMVLAMLLNIVALASFAIPADTVCELTLVADKEYYAPGDEITLTVYGQTAADCTGLEMAGQYIFGYNSSAIAPYSDSTDLTQHGFTAAPAHAAAFDNSGSQTVFSDVLVNNMATTISNGDQIIGYFIAESTETYVPSVDSRVELFSFKMKVADTAADGEYKIEFNRDSWADYNSYVFDEVMGGLYGSSGTDFGFAETNMFAFNDATIKVGAATEASIIKDGGSQIRFRGIGATGTVADYKGTFDVRTVATISEEDFAAKFTDDATAIASIAEIGFIYAAKSNVAAFDVETAQNAAKTLADKESLNGYVKKTVSHIQHVEGQPYKFTCLIDNIADADNTDAVSALAYIELTTGEYIFADAAIFADYAELYGRMPK